MTKEEFQHVRSTMLSPGWKIIQARAASAIETMKLEALMNTEESQVLSSWRNAQAAYRILNVFLQELENPDVGIDEE